ncbi:hypothetical protein [Marinospirillum alkaliphilum]|uniref:Uncharacterized protein n=1 Tax=Marinospirillum alkaliphilum DSM 21637 TaxID=1122209 RepID=A0A1K1Z7M0_9GAMM|nr:hypothetical protein [Marinospirillum alkaliphilum]SFX69541.1 hypothetical protein SAMN02745752_02557 [Marinospirillum alkaliphilum DSM 21637]
MKLKQIPVLVLAGLMLSGVVLTGCAGIDQAERERRAAYEQSREQERIDRIQRETDAATRRLDEQTKR